MMDYLRAIVLDLLCGFGLCLFVYMAMAESQLWLKAMWIATAASWLVKWIHHEVLRTIKEPNKGSLK